MEITEIPQDRIDEIESLWVELNSHHGLRSENFESHFSSFTFAERKRKLLSEEKLKILVAKDKGEIVGYCIASSSKGIGEIDSLYIKPQHRGSSIGMKLSDSAMSWLTSLNCSQISVYVAEGNEEAIPFYEKLGFRKRFQVLQIKNS